MDWNEIGVYAWIFILSFFLSTGVVHEGGEQKDLWQIGCLFKSWTFEFGLAFASALVTITYLLTKYGDRIYEKVKIERPIQEVL